MSALWAKQKGFTIVELLIVIVVIAILAAITIVAFNGIQNRAENTKTAQAVTQYVKIMKMYATTYGVYPTNVSPPTAPASNFWNCLPYDANAGGTTVSGASPSCFGLNYTWTNAGFKADLGKVATTLPAVSNRVTDCANGYSFQGALVHVYNSGTSVDIAFPQIGDVSCPQIGGAGAPAKALEVGTTRCWVTLPNLQ